MKQKISGRRILTLLSSLKNIESQYPSRMMQARRQRYIRQVAAAVAVKTDDMPNRPPR
ncbi:MAG: hypothetical protein Kow0070_26670 [Anaerolineales bacterium]